MATTVDEYPKDFPAYVHSNTVITYLELRNTFVNWVKGIADNLNMNNIPAEFKNGYSQDTPHCGVGWTNVSLSSGGVTGVSEATITSDVDAFMAARGINTKSNKPVTTKGIIQFWNYASIFCAARFARCYSCMTMATPLIYNTGSVTYTEPGLSDDGAYIKNTDVTHALSGLMDTINNYTRVKAMLYSYRAHCCCCSSSSCSSSSSSFFIGFMKLTT